MSAPIFWHGGHAGLRPGAFLLPPSESGAAHTLYDHGTKAVARRDRVYVTTSFAAAVLYACGHPSGGAVYQIDPLGELAPDPDCTLPGLSFECERARIVRVHVPTRAQRVKVRKAMRRMLTEGPKGVIGRGRAALAASEPTEARP